MKGLTFGQIQDLVNNTCRAMDIRGIALKRDSEWQCVLSIVRLTYRSTEKINQDQKALRNRLGEVGNENVVVFFDSWPISEFQSLLAEVRQGHLNVAGRHLMIECKRNDLLSEKLLEYGHLSQNEPDMLYPCYEVQLLSENEPRKLLEAAGITGPSLGIHSVNDLQSWLGASVFGSTVVMVITVPVYAQVYHPLHLKAGDVQAQFSAHDWLLKRARIIGMLRPSYNQSPVERGELDLQETARSENIVTGVVKRPFTLDATQRDARVEFQFLDTELGILATGEGFTAQMLAPDQAPLYTAFSYFEGGRNLETYLLDPKGKQADSQFSSAVSWLLELCGFRVLNLSALPDAEHLRIDGKEEGSCDIIAVAESIPASLLIVDCTTAVPRQDKFARIRLTAEEIAKQAASLFGKLQVTVRPVIAISKEVPELRNPEYIQAGTYVLDKSQLQTLMELVRVGNREKAARAACDMLSLPYPATPTQ